MKKHAFRVSYQDGGKQMTSFVVAASGADAVGHLGIGNDTPVQVSPIAQNIEVVGMDAPHPPVLSIPPTKAPFELPKAPSMAQFNALQAQVAELLAKQASTDQPSKK